MLKEIRKVQDALGKLFFILNREQKRYCVLIFLMSLASALIETVGVSIIVPVVQIVISVDELMEQDYVRPLIELFHLETSAEVITVVCIGVGIIYIIKNAYSFLYTWAAAKFSNKIRRELAVRVLRTYMSQGYIFFVDHNSSTLIRGISSDVNSVQNVIAHFFSFMCKVLIIICMTLFIIVSTPLAALLILGIVIFCFAVSQLVFRNPMRRFGAASREYSYRASQASLEAIQGYKEILVFGRQDYFVNEYLKNMIGYNKAEVQMTVASASPSFMIEVVCIIGILAVVAVQSITAGGNADLLAQMVIIALATLRILPALGILLGDVNAIVFNAPGLNSAAETLHMVKGLEEEKADEKKEGFYADVSLKNELTISHVSYAYPRTDKNVIDDLSMVIEKGTSVGLIGTSGAGKTTLADIVLGLLKPQSGRILMDGTDIEQLGEAWHNIVGYVPQSVYMTDASVRRNVAFGIKEDCIDDEKVWKALEMAQIKDFIKGLAKGLDTNVGEWGVQLSGGQRQRIAIARALYNEPDIIVLDEATAALDNETENAVMESIEALQKVKTLIIVAHRLTTIRKCDVIYEIADGKAIQRKREEVLAEEVRGNEHQKKI